MKHLRVIEKLPPEGRYVLISDLHLGIGNQNDDSVNNQYAMLYFLQQCFQKRQHVIILGDLFELVRNGKLNRIEYAHNDIMCILCELDKRGLLTYVRGNHDNFLKEKTIRIRTNPNNGRIIPFLTSSICDGVEIGKYLLVHGHQAQFRFSNKITCWLYNHLILKFIKNTHSIKNITPEFLGWQEPNKVDLRLDKIGRKENKIIIAGHTHKLMHLDNYYNIGSFGVLPKALTYGLLDNGKISLYMCSQKMDASSGYFTLVNSEIDV